MKLTKNHLKQLIQEMMGAEGTESTLPSRGENIEASVDTVPEQGADPLVSWYMGYTKHMRNDTGDPEIQALAQMMINMLGGKMNMHINFPGDVEALRRKIESISNEEFKNYAKNDLEKRLVKVEEKRKEKMTGMSREEAGMQTQPIKESKIKLTGNYLKQLIREEMEAEEMEAEGEKTESLDFVNPQGGIYKFPSNYWIVGPERERAKKDDPQMKELEKHVMDGGEGLILGKSDGRINVLIVFRDVNPFTGLDRGVGWGREGHSGGGTRGGLDLSPEDALDYLKRGAELIQDKDAKEAFMSVTEEDLEIMPDDTYFVAKTDKKGPKKERPKSRPSRGSGRIEADDKFFDSGKGIEMRRRKQAARYARANRGRFEEGKLTKSRLKQMIREEFENLT